MGKHEVSVIVPVFNSEKFLERCVNSILSQSFKNFELLLVDDCSTDASPQICDDFAKLDKRIKVLHLNKNVGLSGARNKGIGAATGEFISLIDSDDWIADNFLETLLGAIEVSGSDICSCAVVWTENPQSINYRPTNEQLTCYSNIEALKEVLTSLSTIAPMAWNKLYRRSLFKEIKYPEGVLHEDVLTTYKLVNISNKVCHTQLTCYYYFQNSESIMRGKFNPQRLTALDHVNDIDEYLHDKKNMLSKEIAVYKYSLLYGLVLAMRHQKGYYKKRIQVINNLKGLLPNLLFNPYISVSSKASLLLTKIPAAYDLYQEWKS